MNTSARSNGRRETDPFKEQRGNPRVDTMLQELCSTKQAAGGKHVGPTSAHYREEGDS